MHTKQANHIVELAADLFEGNPVFMGLKLQRTLDDYELLVYHTVYSRNKLDQFDKLNQAGNKICSTVYELGTRVHVSYWSL